MLLGPPDERYAQPVGKYSRVKSSESWIYYKKYQIRLVFIDHMSQVLVLLRFINANMFNGNDLSGRSVPGPIYCTFGTCTDTLEPGGYTVTFTRAGREPRAVAGFSVNVDPAGAPVAAVGLDELGVDAHDLGDQLMTRYAQELATAAYAETKVREVD